MLLDMFNTPFYLNILGVCLKQNALTGIYLFLLLYLPLIKTPTPKNIKGKFRSKLYCCFERKLKSVLNFVII